MKFAISSCWNSHRHNDGYDMLVELAELGFQYVELSHGTRISLVPGALKAIEENLIKVSSLHNFCPLPLGVMGAAPNLYEPAAASKKERILWLHNTIKTIDFAQRVECDRIVLHSGNIRLLWGNPASRVDAAFESADSSKSIELKAVREKGLKRLNSKKNPFMKRLKESFSLIAEKAKEAGVRIGIENREGFSEIPLDDDMPGLLGELQELEVFGYWHDSGHAQLKERMGLLDHRTFLSGLRPHLIGYHLHDVTEKNRDHQVPGTGVIDWTILADNIREGDVVVMEMSPRLTAQEILQGKEFLERTVPALKGK